MSLEASINAAIEVLKIGIWPATIIWAIWFLRDEVKRAAARITELGPTGAKFAPPSAQIPQPPPDTTSAGLPSPVGSSTGHLPGAGASAQQYITNIRASFPADELEPMVQTIRAELPLRAGTDQASQIEVLIYTVASLNLQVMHERNYRAIFGSQIQALAQMNAEGGGLPDTIRATYEAAKATYPEAYRSYTFEQWIGFLQNASLCKVDERGNYVLTPFGRGFLRYLLDLRLPISKPF
jgi:hypothetical protein